VQLGLRPTVRPRAQLEVQMTPGRARADATKALAGADLLAA